MDLIVFTFKDDRNNSVQILAPSKTQACKMVKRINFGGVMRCVEQRPMTADEVKQRAASAVRPARSQALDGGPRLVRKRLAFGRNDRCPCGSGKKVKHCCARREYAGPSAGPAQGSPPR